jgi:hypothetical protein
MVGLAFNLLLYFIIRKVNLPFKTENLETNPKCNTSYLVANMVTRWLLTTNLFQVTPSRMSGHQRYYLHGNIKYNITTVLKYHKQLMNTPATCQFIIKSFSNGNEASVV